MDSTTFLRRGFSPAPPRLPTTALLTRRLPLSFRCNVSSIHLLVEKSNENYNKYRRCNKNNNGIDIDIHCFKVVPPSSTSKGGGNFPSPNAKMALQSLFCFSFDNAVEPHTKDITGEKKRALQALLAQNPVQAEKIMRDLYQKYQKNRNGQIRYDATLAFIQVLIHLGTNESLDDAIKKLNEIELIPDKPSDARPSLYRAIIYTLLDEIKDAKTFWWTYTGYIGTGPKHR
ncbi:uncharacterized protein LOC120083532 [Benincasa hispida]|uniref:uncharacterized protein LOC120083532 n=1 Tax=Benincasa hispida TaxID=102211 RepID=UPI00190220F9|nr:uncharacterized protein LOC120083532 [Benincasa hispida]